MEDIIGLENLIAAYRNSNEADKINAGRQLYSTLKRLGHISESIGLLEELIDQNPKQRFLYRELNFNEELLDLFNEYSRKITQTKQMDLIKIPGTSFNGKIVHVLNTSIPYLNNGYSIRSKYIIENQKTYGFEPIVITRPGFPNDFFSDTIINCENELFQENVNDITYYRPSVNTFLRYTPIKQYIEGFSQRIQDVIEMHNPDIIHAASNYVIGMAGLTAARRSCKPFIYEVRGFWEYTKASKEPLFLKSEVFRLSQVMETYLAYNADGIVVICEQLKKELEKRGVDPSKITIVPNGVDCNLFDIHDPDEELKNQYRQDKYFIIGYIGSLVEYEGLQILLKALARLKARGYAVKAVIVGDGDYKQTLENLSLDLNLSSSVYFTGKVEHSRVVQYYSLFDVCVYPRVKDDVTDLVTPLKPLEAMACGKAVIGSNADALKEIIIPHENGLLFNNTLQDLCRNLAILYRHKGLKEALGRKARAWVEKNRDWYQLVSIYETVYNGLYSEKAYKEDGV